MRLIDVLLTEPHTNQTSLEESLPITTLYCNLVIATHARKMHK